MQKKPEIPLFLCYQNDIPTPESMSADYLKNIGENMNREKALIFFVPGQPAYEAQEQPLILRLKELKTEYFESMITMISPKVMSAALKKRNSIVWTLEDNIFVTQLYAPKDWEEFDDHESNHLLILQLLQQRYAGCEITISTMPDRLRIDCNSHPSGWQISYLISWA